MRVQVYSHANAICVKIEYTSFLPAPSPRQAARLTETSLPKMMTDDTSTVDKPEDFSLIARAAEKMLSGVLGSPTYFTSVERLSEPGRRNLLLRCLSTPFGDFPYRFIIKKVEAESYQPDDPNSWDTQRFFSDWIGSQFLSSLENGTHHGPRFFGGNRDAGFIILEDLGPHRSLVEPLLHEDASSAESALLRYSTRLGKMHADTVNKSGVFENLWRSANTKAQPFTPKESDFEEGMQQVQKCLERLGVAAEAGFIQEIRRIVAAVMNPGPFLAYTHGDPCPDNVFDDGEQLRLIDFEFGHFGHALFDATYGRMIFPTCWCANRLPSATVEKMESLYRTELVRGCSEAQEDSVFEEALVTVCGFWLLNTLARHLEPSLEDDQDWGIASLRQRILARLEAFVATSEEFGHLPAVHGTAGRLLDCLGKQWTAVLPLPMYPAFQ